MEFTNVSFCIYALFNTKGFFRLPQHLELPVCPCKVLPYFSLIIHIALSHIQIDDFFCDLTANNLPINKAYSSWTNEVNHAF